MYKQFSIGNSFKNSELVSKMILSIPMHPYLSNKELDKIILTINKFYE